MLLSTNAIRSSCLRNSLRAENLHLAWLLPLSHCGVREGSTFPSLARRAEPTPQERRERRKHETLVATSTSWDRPLALLKLWKHRRSACRNHCSPILTTFSCVGDGDKGRRITRPFKGFSTSFLIIGKSRGNGAPSRSSNPSGNFAFSSTRLLLFGCCNRRLIRWLELEFYITLSLESLGVDFSLVLVTRCSNRWL